MMYSFEAEAWFAWKNGAWETAHGAAQRWHSDQPFSSRPAIFGSYLTSSVIEDYDQAVAFAELGLLSNPDDFSLHNNLAFSLAMRGDVQRAEEVLRTISKMRLSARASSLPCNQWFSCFPER